MEELRREAVQTLLKLNAEVNQKTTSGNTVFSVLVGHNYSRIRVSESKRKAMMEIATTLVKAESTLIIETTKAKMRIHMPSGARMIGYFATP